MTPTSGFPHSEPDACEVSPCEKASRWRRLGDTCASATPLDALTAASLAAAFYASTDINPMVRDIAAPEGDCTTELDGVSAIGAKLQMAGDLAGCWQHVHPHTLDVRDFSYWSANHPGNRVAEKYGRRNPITRWAELDSAAIVFPYHHLIQQWSGKEALFPLVGRLGDSVDFAALPTSVQTSAMATLLGAAADSVAGGVEACGSPGEVANDPALGHHFKMYMTEYARGEPEVHRDYVNGMAKKSACQP